MENTNKLNPNQRKVMTHDGRISIVSDKIWRDPEKMARYRLTLHETYDAVKPVLVNAKTETAHAISNEELIAKLKTAGIDPATIGIGATPVPQAITDEQVTAPIAHEAKEAVDIAPTTPAPAKRGRPTQDSNK